MKFLFTRTNLTIRWTRLMSRVEEMYFTTKICSFTLEGWSICVDSERRPVYWNDRMTDTQWLKWKCPFYVDGRRSIENRNQSQAAMTLPSSFATRSWTSHRKVLTLALGLFSRSFAIFAPRTFFQSHYQVALKRSITTARRVLLLHRPSTCLRQHDPWVRKRGAIV